MFGSEPKARADLKPGTIYAVGGENGFIYYGQVTPGKEIGFFRRRDRDLVDVQDVLTAPILSVVVVNYPSITRALRAGQWKKLGRFAVVEALRRPRCVVLWSVGTLRVTVHQGSQAEYETSADDPAIQDFEVMAVWDAVDHIPSRLTADFGVEPPEWHVGGPIWRERKVKEEYARRFPNQPWHQLPSDWVPFQTN